jgi:hypothetical protein
MNEVTGTLASLDSTFVLSSSTGRLPTTLLQSLLQIGLLYKRAFNVNSLSAFVRLIRAAKFRNLDQKLATRSRCLIMNAVVYLGSAASLIISNTQLSAVVISAPALRSLCKAILRSCSEEDETQSASTVTSYPSRRRSVFYN